MTKIPAAIIAALAFISASFPVLAQTKNFALVVGINNYDHMRTLETALSDAEAVTNVLHDDLDFNVDTLPDASRIDILAHWQQLLANLSRDSIAVFYFAGHGVQLEGQNFLIPKDASITGNDPNVLRKSTIDMRELLDGLGKNQIKTEATGIFILDACRNTPAQLNSAGDPNQGLAPIRELPRKMFVMYSAGIGQTALDKPTGAPPGSAKNSVYTTELIPLLKEQKSGEVPLAEMAQVLRYRVYKAAKRHYQTPAYYDQLIRRETILGAAINAPRRVAADDTHPQLTSEETRGLGLEKGDIYKECLNCPEMVVVGAETFNMGSLSAAQGAAKTEAEKGTVSVEIKNLFMIGRFEVMNSEWNACVKATEDLKLAESGCSGWRDVSGEGGHDRDPVSGVTWDEARRYVAWLNTTLGGGSKQQTRYRLPTETEWEFAARAGTDTAYSFGDDPKDLCKYANGADSSIGSLVWINWHCRSDDVGRAAAQTGSYPPNDWKLFDVHGNVAEWVEDCWQPSLEAIPKDGTALNAEPCERRVVRGGSWRSDPSALRSAARNAVPPSVARTTIGFRVVREMEK